jgi:hypothetical protein
LDKVSFILNFKWKALKITLKKVTVPVVRVRYLKEIASKIIIQDPMVRVKKPVLSEGYVIGP